MEGTETKRGRTLAAIAVVLLAIAAVAVLIGELSSTLVAGVLAGAGVAALAAWANERAARRRYAALDERRRGEMAERTREAERGAAQELTRERELRLRTERARRAEREWTRELRDQVLTMHRNRGPNGSLHELVMQVALRLTGAARGFLLDDRLEIVCHQGFEEDPPDSPLAERALNKEEIVREDNLVAIPLYLHDDLQGVIVCTDSPNGFADLDDNVLLAFGDQAGTVLDNHRLQGRLRATYLATVRMLADAIEANDPFVRARSDDVSACIEAVGRRLELDTEQTEQLVFAGLLRDVGKLGISDRVLLKPGPLNADERGIVELHPLIGSRLVERVPGLKNLAPIIRHHHERWDGGGYPGALQSEAIPIESRVIAVADTYAALTSNRPYRRPVSSEQACQELEGCAGTQFDPQVVELFVKEMRRRAPAKEQDGTLAESVHLPAVQARRVPDEPLLGHGAVAATDHVTLLYSHRFLHEAADAEASRAKRHQRPFAVVIAELSDLPEINRRAGYAAGDLALQELGRAVEQALEGIHATPGRVSGRRLAVVLPDTGHHGASAIAARVLDALDGHHNSVRTGVAVWQLGDHGDDVLARARMALDAAAAE